MPNAPRIILTAFLVAIGAPSAHADFIYDFTAANTIIGDYAWAFSTPTILQATTTGITNFLSTSPAGGCDILSASITNPATEFHITTFFFGGACGTGSQDVASSLFPGITAPGTYRVTIPPAAWTLNINQAPVPEPASLLLLGTGLVGIVCAVRRKLLT